MLSHPLGQLVATEFALSSFVVHPNARGSGACHVGANDHFYRKRPTLSYDHDIWVGRGQEVVGCNVVRVLEPPASAGGEQLTLQGKRPKDSIEGADPIRDDNDSTSVMGSVVVANLAFIARPQTLELSAL